MVTLSRSTSGAWTQHTTWNRVAIYAATLLVWALAIGSVIYWGMRLNASPAPTSVAPQMTPAVMIDPVAVARLLGARNPTPVMQASLASRFSLQGVVSGGPGGGAALISMDGQPAKAFVVGSTVHEGLILQSTRARSVTLADSQGGPGLLTLDMPLLR